MYAAIIVHLTKMYLHAQLNCFKIIVASHLSFSQLSHRVNITLEKTYFLMTKLI